MKGIYGPLLSITIIVGCKSMGARQYGDPDNSSVNAASGTELQCNDPKAGPQSPRSILDGSGNQAANLAKAPPFEALNLCNVHFHRGAEHRGHGFLDPADPAENRDFVCNEDPEIEATKERYRPTRGKEVECSELSPNDTIEIHWVFTSCPVNTERTSLNACLCDGQQLRVESQVFLLSDKDTAVKMSELAEFGKNNTGSSPVPAPVQSILKNRDSVEYLGSTTGPHFTNEVCSPFLVTWNVRKNCEKLSVKELKNWCEDNEFKAEAAHGARGLVTDRTRLSIIP
jgi:hypothetical protein